jgi:hypothetical protein
MAKAKGSSKPEEGTIYVTSFGKVITEQKLDVDKISKYLDNIYLAGALDKQQRTLFRNKKEFKVVGRAPDGSEDEDLSERLTSMCMSQDVDAWFNSQIAWRESAAWGPALFNPVWEWEENEYVLKKLRHLPSETFSRRGYTTVSNTFVNVVNPILPGIALNDKGEMEFWQLQLDRTVKQLTNVFMITDPVRAGYLGGKPLIKPIIPVVTMIDFCWTGQMQQNNRLGAGGLFYIKVVKPQKDDSEYATKIIRNIGRGVAYQLRENMELQNVGINQTSTALETINALDQLLGNYFSPASSIQKEGTLIGGSDNAAYNLYLSYIEGQQAWVSSGFERLLNPYLLMNGYDGYTIEFGLPMPSVDRSQMLLSVIGTGFNTKTIGLNERRKVMETIGIEAPELDDAGRAALAQEFKDLSGVSATPLDQANALAALTNNPLDRYGLVSQDKAKELANKYLGIEEGQQ